MESPQRDGKLQPQRQHCPRAKMRCRFLGHHDRHRGGWSQRSSLPCLPPGLPSSAMGCWSSGCPLPRRSCVVGGAVFRSKLRSSLYYTDGQGVGDNTDTHGTAKTRALGHSLNSPRTRARMPHILDNAAPQPAAPRRKHYCTPWPMSRSPGMRSGGAAAAARSRPQLI
jgi:hypothetical protein